MMRAHAVTAETVAVDCNPGDLTANFAVMDRFADNANGFGGMKIGNHTKPLTLSRRE